MRERRPRPERAQYIISEISLVAASVAGHLRNERKLRNTGNPHPGGRVSLSRTRYYLRATDSHMGQY